MRWIVGIVWCLVLVACWWASSVFGIALNDSESAVQQAAGFAMVCAIVVTAYVFARAVEALIGSFGTQQLEYLVEIQNDARQQIHEVRRLLEKRPTIKNAELHTDRRISVVEQQTVEKPIARRPSRARGGGVSARELQPRRGWGD